MYKITADKIKIKLVIKNCLNIISSKAFVLIKLILFFMMVLKIIPVKAINIPDDRKIALIIFMTCALFLSNTKSKIINIVIMVYNTHI